MQASTCTNCGNLLGEGAQFCPGCGSRAATAQASVQSHPPSSAVSVMGPPEGSMCADCGNSLREGAQFCPVCGSAVATAQPPAQSHEPSSSSPVMSPPTPPSATAPTRPDAPLEPDPQSRASRAPDSARAAALIPRMTPPAPDPQTATSPATVSPTDPGTSGGSGFPGRPRPRLSDRRVLAAGAGLFLLVIAAVVVFALSGNSPKHTATAKLATKPAAAVPAAAPVTSPAATSTAQTSAPATGATGASTGTTPTSQTPSQLASLDSILNLAETGRQALTNGDITATIANRRTVLQELDALQPDSQLSASVQALKAAESYSLHADTTCGLNCSVSVDQGATRLKQAFLAIFNPIAARYGTQTYAAGEI